MSKLRTDFYVYAWRRPDTGEPFYVGKGTGSRATSMNGRNPIFRRILRKLEGSGQTAIVEMLHTDLSEGEAHSLECQEIARYGRIDIGTGCLANLTDGGEGQVGLRHSASTKAKISTSKTGQKYGPASQERKDKASVANRGKTRSPETVAANLLAQHMRGPRAIGASGLKGVTYHADRGKWGARIMINGKERNLGRFETPEEAALVRDKAAIAAFGVGNCYINFPDKVAA